MTEEDAMAAKKSLEAGLRAILAMVAAVFGLGLKSILDDESLGHERWPIFLIAALTFSRYLIGAAVHITHTHINKIPDTRGRAFLIDVAFLTVYALVGLAACIEGSPRGFLLWIFLLIGVSIVWYRLAKNAVGFKWKNGNYLSTGVLMLLVVVDVVFESTPEYFQVARLVLLIVLVMLFAWVGWCDMRAQLRGIGLVY